MIEAELKARLTDPDTVRTALSQRATGDTAIYHDTYFDTLDEQLDSEGRELRVRTISTGGTTRHVMTYKEPAVDVDSGSKPEYETEVASADVASYIVEGLGYVPVVHLTKQCSNFEFDEGGRRFVATVVRVPELADTFLEVETQVPAEQLDEALTAVRAVIEGLGVPAGDLTTEKYTDAVRAART
jgi:adenylate cyclase class 2